MILNIEKYASKYLYANLDTPTGDIYYCDCGEIFTKGSADEEVKKELVDAGTKVSEMSMDEELAAEFRDIYKGVKLGFEEEVKCPKCSRNFQSSLNRETLIVNGNSFISGYSFKETDSDLFLYYSVIKPDLKSIEKVDFSEDFKYLRFEKETKKLFYKDLNRHPNLTMNEVEFDLDETISIVDKFFVFETTKIVNMFDLHLFLGRVSNFIIDAKNIDIIHELLDSLQGKAGDSGVDVIKKIISIFFGIIKYSNLSTIAMTKSSVFLYDLMLECKMPKPQILIENNITSPIKIFNFLIQNYVNKLSEEVNSDNKEVHEFTFKSKQRISFDDNGENVKVEKTDEEQTVKFQIRDANDYIEGKVKKAKGQYQVEDAVEDGTVSKFVFKQIRNFSDYKKIIKFFKLVERQELITLLQKYEIDFLLNVIDLIYFRKKLQFKELERLLDIILDATAVKSKENCAFLDGILRMNYDFVKDFDFITYDDTLMMIEVLEFDPKVQFTKIKTWKGLTEYHDNLITYFSVLKDEQKNGSIMNFVSKFRFLEDRKDYDGPLEIRLLATPSMIINEGIEMKHSASAYASQVAQGFYLMGQVYDKSPERKDNEPPRYTIGFNYDKLSGLEFDQVKGFANELGGAPMKSDRFKKEVMNWLTIKDVSYRPIKDLKLSGEDMDRESEL
jgi:hypothetical protein